MICENNVVVVFDIIHKVLIYSAIFIKYIINDSLKIYNKITM